MPSVLGSPGNNDLWPRGNADTEVSLLEGDNGFGSGRTPHNGSRELDGSVEQRSNPEGLDIGGVVGLERPARELQLKR